jgi:hypothetical protein
MAIPSLGKLEKIENLKDVWDNEATSFTPWLAKEENIALLAEAIGFDELVVEAQEKSVGPFRADLLCKETTTDSWVLIENQLERTDHTHLGQLLTYAAGLNAVTIVWIAKRFTDEHRATLDWINEITDERFNFFGLEVELWRIGHSAIAPKFNVVSKPNNWTKTIVSAAKQIEATSHTPRELLMQEYWTALRSFLENSNSPVRTQKPLPQGWTNAALGRSGIYLLCAAKTQKKCLYVQVTIHGPNRKAFFAQLKEQSKEIEGELGFIPEWRELPDKTESHIRLTWDHVDPADKSNWQEQHQWFLENLNKFHMVLARRVKDLEAAPEVAV